MTCGGLSLSRQTRLSEGSQEILSRCRVVLNDHEGLLMIQLASAYQRFESLFILRDKSDRAKHTYRLVTRHRLREIDAYALPYRFHRGV